MTGGGDGADGVVASGAFNDDQTELVLTLDTGGTVTVNVPAALRAGGILASLNSDGTAPDASANQGKVLFSGNQILHSINHGGHDKEVTFKEYGPDRVVVGSEPVRSANENNYGGSFEFPPHDDIADYDVDTVLWDRGSEVWLLKPASDSTRWSSYSGPLGWEHGHIYATEAVAERHVGSALAVGKIFIYGYGSTQKPYIVTAFTAATDDVWVWDPLGVTLQDVENTIDQHLSTKADINLQNIDQDLSDTEKDNILEWIGSEAITDELATAKANTNLSNIDDDLSGAALTTILSRLGIITPYSSTGTYRRGRMVTHTNGLFMYTSGTARSSNHDPDTHPGYWLKLSEGVAYEVISSGSHRVAARTIIVNGDNDRVYLCTTTQTTPVSLSEIHTASQSLGGAFIHLNAAGGGSDAAELTQAQVEDSTDTTFGLVSGERLAEAVAAHETGGSNDGPMAFSSRLITANVDQTEVVEAAGTGNTNPPYRR